MSTSIVSTAVAGLGAVLILAGAVGVLRLPDTLSRMHAAGVASSAGLLLVLAGAVIANPVLAPVVGIAAVLQVLAAPVGAHVLARAVHHHGGEPTRRS